MKITPVLKIITWSILFFVVTSVNAQTVSTEYADKLVGKYYSHANIYFTDLYGGEGFNFPISIDPHLIEGANTTYFVSLPLGSYVVMEFTNNKIIDYPGQDDIYVTENGCNNERAEVYVSSDGKKFIQLGVVDDCYESSLDLGSIGFKGEVRFVKVVGLDLNGGSPGFDLVNIKGLPKSSVEVVEDAVADSLDNLSAYGFNAFNNQNASGNEWTIESEKINEAQIFLYGPDKSIIPIDYKLIEPHKIVIDAAGFKKGVYTIEIKLKNEVITQKINIV